MAMADPSYNALVSLATFLNAEELIVRVLSELSADTLSGEIDGNKVTSDFGRNIIAAKLRHELTILAGAQSC